MTAVRAQAILVALNVLCVAVNLAGFVITGKWVFLGLAAVWMTVTGLNADKLRSQMALRKHPLYYAAAAREAFGDKGGS